MKTNNSSNNGLGKNGGGQSVAQLLSAFSEDDYRGLVRYARVRLRGAADARSWSQDLAITDAEDLVHQAVFKLLLGDLNPALGRHVKARHRVSLGAFLPCIKGVISSDIYNLVSEANRRRSEAFLGDPAREPGAIEPSEPAVVPDLLSRRDLHRVFFRRLYARIENHPALLAVVQDWEQRFWEDTRIGAPGMNRDLVYRVRQLAREVIAELAAELPPPAVPGEGEGMSF